MQRLRSTLHHLNSRDRDVLYTILAAAERSCGEGDGPDRAPAATPNHVPNRPHRLWVHSRNSQTPPEGTKDHIAYQGVLGESALEAPAHEAMGEAREFCCKLTNAARNQVTTLFNAPTLGEYKTPGALDHPVPLPVASYGKHWGGISVFERFLSVPLSTGTPDGRDPNRNK